MPDAFDLSKLLKDNPLDFEHYDNVDVSGRPAPTNVRVQLNSGIEVKCEVRYSGTNKVDGDRLFTVIAEIDWENYHPKLLLVEEMPNDVEFRFRIPGMSDADASNICRGLQLIPERIIGVK
jgi:hypothetical protein